MRTNAPFASSESSESSALEHRRLRRTCTRQELGDCKCNFSDFSFQTFATQPVWGMRLRCGSVNGRWCSINETCSWIYKEILWDSLTKDFIMKISSWKISIKNISVFRQFPSNLQFQFPQDSKLSKPLTQRVWHSPKKVPMNSMMESSLNLENRTQKILKISILKSMTSLLISRL